VWTDDVFDHAAHCEDADLECLLAVARLTFRKLALEDPDNGDAQNARD